MDGSTWLTDGKSVPNNVGFVYFSDQEFAENVVIYYKAFNVTVFDLRITINRGVL